MARILCIGRGGDLTPADWAVIGPADRATRQTLRDRGIRTFLDLGPITDRADLVEQADRLTGLMTELAPDGIALHLAHTELDAEVAANIQSAAETANPAVEMLLICTREPDFAELDEFADHYVIPAADARTRARTTRTVLTVTPGTAKQVDGVYVPH
ncbi:hypothetical protein [Crossiella cryophila]|uniref:Uncharacterized protein n=1 Tax=Crossiella cryophila TaxID=43355 RepID=A0A7W7C9P9_9PSEU|nr:hypothetical protein [Crossiella cryophila]MBB4677126.1 hypothetical protein [Crossiella cryophila]